jgi:hypothetical protein
MRLTKEFKLDVGISIILLAIFLFVVILFTGCSDNGDHYNTPEAQVLTVNEYPLNKWRAEHEQATYRITDIYGKADITYNFWHH